MNFINGVKSIWMMLMLLAVLSVAALAQDTYYVRNDAQGDDLTAVKNNPMKPYKTIKAAIGAAAAGDIISIACMTYDEAQVTINKAVTVISTVDNGLTVATINNGFIIDKAGATINLGTGSSAGFLLKNGPSGALNLKAGALNVITANVTLIADAMIYRSAGSMTAAPTFAGKANVFYSGESKTAGPELPADCKGGIINSTLALGKTLTVNTSVKAADIQNGAGNIVFNDKVVTNKISNPLAGNITFNAYVSTKEIVNIAGILNFLAGVDLFANGNQLLNDNGVIKLNSSVMAVITEDNGILINNVNGGKIISDESLVVGKGVINFVGTTGKIVTVFGEVPNMVIPAEYKGFVNAIGTLTIVGEFKLASSVVGAFNDNGNKIEVYEDFLRLNNTIGNYATTGQLWFKGSVAQVFNPGLQMTFPTVVIANTKATVTLTEALWIGTLLEIKANAKLDLDGFNIVLRPGANFINNGEYITTGNGLLIVGYFGPGVSTLSGSGPFSNLDLRGGATVLLGSDVNFAGTMTLREGILDLNTHTATLVSTAYAPVPKIIRYAGKAEVIPFVGGQMVLADAIHYDLVYEMCAAAANAGPEWIGSGINDLTIKKGSADFGGTDGNITAPLAEATSVYGVLTVDKGQSLTLNGANLTFLGANKTHTVSGAIFKTLVTDELVVKANAVALNGGSGISTVPGIKLNLTAAQTFTSTGLKDIEGNITNVNGTSSIVMASASNTIINGNVLVQAGMLTLTTTTSGTTAHNGDIVIDSGKLLYTRSSSGVRDLNGNLTLNGGTFALGSSVKVLLSTTQNDGVIDLGAYDLIMVGPYTRVAGTITASTGKLVVNYPAPVAPNPPLLFTPGADFSVPNLEIKGIATVAGTNDILVTNSFTMTSGYFDIGNNNLILEGNVFKYSDGTLAANLGWVELKGPATKMTLAYNLTLMNLKLNTTGSVTVLSNDVTIARDLTVMGYYLQEAGDLNLGKNNLVITGKFVRKTGFTTMTTGYVVLAPSVAVDQGDNWSVDNLKIFGPTVMADKPFTVNKSLILCASLDAIKDGNLKIGDGATIERTNAAATLAKKPAFLGKVNLVYSGPLIVTGKEVPTTDIIVDFTVTETGTVTIANGTAVKVNGTLSVSAPGKLTLGDRDLTMANMANLKLVNGDFDDLIDLNGNDFMLAGFLNIEYQNDVYPAGILTSDAEFGDGDKVMNVTISGRYDVKMHAEKVILGTLRFTNSGNLDMNGNNLMLAGDVIQEKTGFIINSCTTPIPGLPVPIPAPSTLSFVGPYPQTVLLTDNWMMPINITFVLAKDHKSAPVTILGGNVNFSDYMENNYRLVLGMGLLNTGDDNLVILRQGIKANGSPDQGYLQQQGVITGNVQKEIFTDNNNPLLGDYAIARSIVTFPVGSDMGDRRDLSMFFKNKLETTVKFTVNHDSRIPDGKNGFPLLDECKCLNITNYSPFFWYVKADVALAPSYKYDLELYGQGYSDYTRDKIQNVRIVRRDSGDVANPWMLQGKGSYYDNSTIDVLWPVVKVIDAMGGITRQGSRFAYSQTNRPPYFVTQMSDITVNETDTVKFTYSVADVDLYQRPVMFCKELPAGSSFDRETGKFVWATTYSDSGKHVVRIGVTDGIDTVYTKAVITVINVKRPAYFVNFLKDVTIKNDSTFTFQYTAKDEDNDPFTFALTPLVDFKGKVTFTNNGCLTLVPAFADAGKIFVVEVKLMRNSAVLAVTSAKVTVQYSRMKGDVDGNGRIQAADASEVLKYVVGLTSLDAQALYAAEVTGDGKVGALDASYILYYCVNGKFPSALAKAVAAVGNVEFGTFGSKQGSEVITLPVNIVEADNVLSAKLVLNVDEKLIDIESVAANMPQGWLMMHNYANGQLTVVMAGVKSMTSGNMMNINLKLKDKEAKVAVDGLISLNDAAETVLNKITVKHTPDQFGLSQNYPNPFNPTTSIKYQLAADSKVNINIYNMLGQLVKTLFSGQQDAGYYTITWDGTNEYGSKVTSGVYIYRLETSSYVAIKKMNLLK